MKSYKKYIIQKDYIKENVDVLREKAKDVRIYAVLKGNAYGMGLIPFAQELWENGIAHFAVTGLEDTLSLRQILPHAQILLLTPCCCDQDACQIVENDITATVGSLEGARLLYKTAESLNKTVTVHIKIDTGFGRYGFLPGQTDELLELKNLTALNIEGIFTHLANAFTDKEKPSLLQFTQFCAVLDQLEQGGLSIPIRHICNSTAIFRFPQMHLTAVRAGSALIGRLPPQAGKTGLKRIGFLETTVGDIRMLPKGSAVGYASLYHTKKQTRLAALQVGYTDGVGMTKCNDTFRFIDILRYIYHDLLLLISPAQIACRIHGKTIYSVGRIGMNNIMFDASSLEDIQCGDIACLDPNPILVNPLIERVYI